jgi:hypothetical protein
MKDSSLEVLNKEFHTRAEELAKQYVDEFAATLLLQSKLLANEDEIVLVKHVEEAREIINRERKKTWHRQLLIVLGSTFCGAFIPGFIEGISSSSSVLTVIYTCVGFLGMLILFLGLRR